MPIKAIPHHDEPLQLKRFQRFLTYLIPLFFIIGPLDIAASYFFNDVGSLAIGLIVIGLGFAFLYARHLLTQNRLVPAVRVTYLGILVPIMALVFFRPFLYPTLAAGAVFATAVALPFVERRELAWITLTSFTVAIGVAVTGALLHLKVGTTIPLAIQVLDVSATMVLVIGLTLLMLWALAGRLRESLTEAEAAHDKLEQANQVLREEDEAKARFMNTAAHEINTPLTPMRIQTDLLLTHRGDSLTDEDRTRALTIIHRNTERLVRLAKDLLDAGRIQAGRLRVDRNRIDLAPLVRQTGDTMGEVANQAGVTLETEVEAGLVADVDAMRLAQVIDIFLTNALKFTPTGGRVKLTAGRHDGQVVVSVTDTGVGLAPEDRELVFEPFRQLDNYPSERRRQGTGLGLHIARGLVEAQDGRVWVESPGEGQGSTFYAAFPYVGRDSATAARPTTSMPRQMPRRSRESARLVSGAGAASGSSRGSRPAGPR